MTEVTGRHVACLFALGFGTIIAVNGLLAWNAVNTFPGVETANSYIASQSFDRDRKAQTALGWDVSARLNGDLLILSITRDGEAVRPNIVSAVFGRATSVMEDQRPAFVFDGRAFVAPVRAGEGNWNLRVVAEAADGTLFRQRLVVEVDA